MISQEKRDDFKEYILFRKEQIEKELKGIEVALAKIDANTFGICERCHKDINIMRLEVKPTTVYCLDCREIISKES